jgi:hypothetical protein
MDVWDVGLPLRVAAATSNQLKAWPTWPWTKVKLLMQYSTLTRHQALISNPSGAWHPAGRPKGGSKPLEAQAPLLSTWALTSGLFRISLSLMDHVSQARYSG